MRYLVTGGLGYVGSWVTRHLAAQGHEVFVLSRGAAAPDMGAPYTLVQGDVLALAPEALAALLPEGLHGCVHAASFNEVFAPGYARNALMVNALGTRNLLEALVLRARSDGAAVPHTSLSRTGEGGAPTHPASGFPLVVYCSTFHVYGQSTGRIDEDTPLLPQNDYALTHLFGEEYCRLFTRVHGLPHITIRLTNGYGAPVTAPFGKWYLLLNDLCRAAWRDKRLVLRSNPSIRRDFVWLGDVAAAAAGLLARPDLCGNVYNIASGAAVTIEGVARLVCQVAGDVLGADVNLVREHPPQHQPSLDVSAAKIHRDLGLVFHERMAEEIRATLDFLARHGGEE